MGKKVRENLKVSERIGTPTSFDKQGRPHLLQRQHPEIFRYCQHHALGSA